MYHYSVPPPGYVRYEYTTSASTSPSSSPSPDHAYAYYTHHHKTTTASPTSRHTNARHARKESYSSPRGPAAWHSPPVYPSPEYYATLPDYHNSRGGQPYVSLHGKPRRFPSTGGGGGGKGNSSMRHASMESPTQRIIIDTSDEADDSPMYTYIKPRTSHHKERSAKADPHFFYNQGPAYDDTSDSQPDRSRARRSSQPTKSRPAVATKPVTPSRQATAADAAKANVPAGFSLKNWDPAEAPILLLGSVFDANSLGKWIYDWTVFYHRPATPITEVAGDLWLLIIKLAGKMARADECLARIKSRHNYEMVEDFLKSGDRLWGRLSALLRACEAYMWGPASKGQSKGSARMSKNAGCEFVDAMFGRDRELEKTESLMQSIRLWDIRFDANCEDILRRSSKSRRSSGE